MAMFTPSSFSANASEVPNLKRDGYTLALIYLRQNAPALSIALACFYFLLIITGSLLNGLVCYVMIKSKRYLKNISCFFITHMAAVDLFSRVVFTPLAVYMTFWNQEEQSPIPCKLSIFVGHSCMAAIFGSLVVIAIDRYRNIVHPLCSLKQKKRPFRIGVLVWAYAVASSAMFLYTGQNVPIEDLPEAKHIERVGNQTSCDITPGWIGGLSVTISAAMIFVIPLVFLVISYTAIFVSLRRRCQNGLVHSAAAKSKAKAARMLMLVVLGFVISFGPSVVIRTLRTFKMLEDASIKSLAIFPIVAAVLHFFGSLANPAIYAIYSDDFKKDMLKTCKRGSPFPRNIMAPS